MNMQEFFIKLNRMLNKCNQLSRIVPLKESTCFEMRIDKHDDTWEHTLTRDNEKGLFFDNELVRVINVEETYKEIIIIINDNTEITYLKTEELNTSCFAFNNLTIIDHCGGWILTIEFNGYTL